MANLNRIESPQFRIKDKRAIRDRWQLLSRKYKAKTRDEEAASGILVDEPSEKEVLIEELLDRESTTVSQESAASKATKDKDQAEEARKSAMERMRQNKCKQKLSDDEDEKPKNSKKRCAQPLVEFLQEKASEDHELHEALMELKKKEQENQNNLMKSMLENQHQLNSSFVDVLKKFLSKD
ncbi:uncharacterized protein LOC110238721 [Exaiptasia diaphana]|uniref:Uncharacterized protein n=1 Tax=Exaiptasia diaphana TaxID=2652724 RepID=A0A913X8H6_EXADI|nr:uncharacterized protein LOC110238721 [Exaiptasia diaphana]KXJ26900.1 hypothetical protein AC249_AIPGENE16404 [Exaiptasia diaphana]